MPSRRDFFDRLGLLDQGPPPPPNPLEVLGIDRAFAGDLLSHDASGETLRIAASGMFRALSRIYHPDTAPPDTDPEKIVALEDAHGRLRDAETSALRGWTQHTSNLNTLIEGLRKDTASLQVRAAETHDRIEAAAGNPNHFERFGGSRGVVVGNQAHLFHIAANGKKAITVTRNGRASTIEPVATRLGLDDQRVIGSESDSIQRFLRDSGRVNLKPPYSYGMYLDGEGGLFVYNGTFTKRPLNLSTAMAEALEATRSLTPQQRKQLLNADWWLRSEKPQFFLVEAAKDESRMRVMKAAIFEPVGHVTHSRTGLNQAWDLGCRVVGTVSNDNFVKGVLTERPQQMTRAIGTGNGVESPALPFKVASVPTEALYAVESDYSPVLAKGGNLLLRDLQTKQLLVTELTVVAPLR